jgi:integrase
VSHLSPFLRSIADFMSVRRYIRPTISTYLYWIKSFLSPIKFPSVKLSFESGTEIRTVQEQLGHHDVKTTEIHTHVLNRGAHGVRTPLSD